MANNKIVTNWNWDFCGYFNFTVRKSGKVYRQALILWSRDGVFIWKRWQKNDLFVISVECEVLVMQGRHLTLNRTRCNNYTDFGCRWSFGIPDRWRNQRVSQVHVPAVCKEDNWKRLHQSDEASVRVSAVRIPNITQYLKWMLQCKRTYTPRWRTFYRKCRPQGSSQWWL